MEKKLLKRNFKRKIKITGALLVIFLITGKLGHSYTIENGTTLWETDGFYNEIINNSIAKADILNKGTLTNRTATITLNSGIKNTRVNKITNQGVMLAAAAGVINNSKDTFDYTSFENTTYSIGTVINEGRMEAKNITGQNYAGNGSVVNNSMRLLNQQNPNGEYIVETSYVKNKGNMSGITRTGGDAGGTGNGINNYLHVGNSTMKLAKASLEKLDNSGILQGGNVNKQGVSSPNGNGFENMGTVGNGILSSIHGVGNTINTRIGTVKNNGIIAGYNEGFGSSVGTNGGNGVASIITDTFSMNPSLNEKAEIKEVTNSGIIMGTNTAIAAFTANNAIVASPGGINNNYSEEKGSIDTVNNYGILAGQKIIKGNVTTENNLGTYIIFDTKTTSFNRYSSELKRDSNGKVMLKELTIGAGGNATLEGINYSILNGNTLGTISSGETVTGNSDTYLKASNLTKNSNLIINGVGRNGALRVDKETVLQNTIINGYEIALKMEAGNGFKGNNIVFNGGGIGNINDNGTSGDIKDDYLEYTNVIEGDAGTNEITLNGDSIINGSVDLAHGDDTLLLANTTQINGTLNGGLGVGDTLGLGQNTTSKATTNLNVFHDISGFETINANGDITLFETTNITDATNINLETGNLTLRVNPTIIDGAGNIIGHSLYGNNGTLTSIDGNLIIGLNGIGENAIIGMGGTQITTGIDSNYQKTDKLITNSLVLDATLLPDGNVLIGVLDYLPPIVPPINPPVTPPGPVNPPTTVNGPLYEKLNQVYKSIVSAGEIGVLANTTLINTGMGNSYLETINGGIASSRDEALGELLVILDQMYANNPYSYTLKSSRDSMKTFEDNLSYLTIKPNEKEWIIQGRAIYTGVKGDNVDYGKNYYGFDTGHRNYKTTTKTIGGLASFEYGLSNDSSVGFAIGGNNQDIKLKGSSEIDGNSLYLGVFAKKEIKNLKFMGGIGYQYSSLDTEREVFNKRDFLKTSDNYDVNTLSTFIEGKYVLDAGDNLKVEPKIRLSYYHVAQDGINEGYTPNNLEMSVNKAEQNTLDLEVGVDFVKTANFKSGKLNGVLTLAAINTFGDKNESLTGQINGRNKSGSDFEIQGTKLESLSGKVGLNLEYEHTNGLIYTVGTDFEFSQNNNRNISGKVGLGYRF